MEFEKHIELNISNIISNKKSITYDYFDTLFGKYELKKQYKISSILEKNNIEILDDCDNTVEMKESSVNETEVILDEEFILAEIKNKISDDKVSNSEIEEIFSYLEINEIEKVKKILQNNGYKIVEYREKNNFNLLRYYSLEEEKALENLKNEKLIEEYQLGNKKMLEILFKKNIRLIYKYISKSEVNYLLDEKDLVQEAFFGFKQSIEKFDLSKNNQFSTYSTWWIKQSINRAIEDKGNIIRIPVHAQEKIKKIFKLTTQEKKINIKKIAAKLKLPEKNIIDYLSIIRNLYRVTSLNSPLKNHEVGENEIIDFCVSPQKNAEDQLLEKELKDAIFRVLKTLKPREQLIIEERFGLNNGEVLTLSAIAKKEKVTRERIRQIEVEALKKLKHPSRRKELKKYLIK